MQSRPAPRAGGAGAAALAAAMGLPGTPPSANSTDGARDPGASSGGDPSPGVLAAQGAIVFSGVGAEGVTPPGTDIEISPKAVPSDGDISHGHQAHGSTSRSIFHVLTEENISPRSTSVDGSVFHEHRGCGFTSESLFHVSMGGSIPQEHHGHIPMERSISPVSLPSHEPIPGEREPRDDTAWPKPTRTEDTETSTSMPRGGSVPQEHPKDGSVSPMSMPMGGSSLLQHREPEGSDEDDADEGTDSGSEEDEDEDEDEEPHFHTNPLFQSPPPPPDAELSAPLALPPGSGHIPRLRLQWGGLDPSRPPTPTDPPHRSPSPIAPIELPQRSPSPITPIEPPLEPLSPITSIEPHHGPPSPITPIEPPQPPPSPTDAPHQPLGEGSPPPSPPRGSPIPGHGCAPGSPSAPPPTQELPPERGAEPPASAQGSPAGGSRAHARLLASRLFRLDGVRRSEVAAFLRRGDAFSAMVAHEYLEWFQFGGQALDQALRSFLRALALSGETQERERVLGHFSRRFHRCNPGAFPSPDAVHSLTCALMLLNTDLHGQRLGRAMSSAQFVANLRGMMDGQDFPRQQLKALYSSIRRQKLPWAVAVGQTRVEALRGGAGGDPPAPAPGGGPPRGAAGGAPRSGRARRRLHQAPRRVPPAHGRRPPLPLPSADAPGDAVLDRAAQSGGRAPLGAPVPRCRRVPARPRAARAARGAQPQLPGGAAPEPRGVDGAGGGGAAAAAAAAPRPRPRPAAAPPGHGAAAARAPALRDLRAGVGVVAPRRRGRAARGGGGGGGGPPPGPPRAEPGALEPRAGPRRRRAPPRPRPQERVRARNAAGPRAPVAAGAALSGGGREASTPAPVFVVRTGSLSEERDTEAGAKSRSLAGVEVGILHKTMGRGRFSSQEPALRPNIG
ncbi:uncharacterized protein PRD47_016304 [Ara ararauna]